MKSLLKEYRYHLGRMIDLAERIGASKEEICNDVIILSAGRLIGFKERRYPAIRQGRGNLTLAIFRKSTTVPSDRFLVISFKC